MNLTKNYAIILASGIGERTGLDVPKQFIKIGGKSIIEHTIEIFEAHRAIDAIIIVCHINYLDRVREIAIKGGYSKISKILAGGATRRESSFIGISSINENNAKVLIHDAVRPFLEAKIIDECVAALKLHNAVDVAIESTDTIIRVNDASIIEEIPQRKYLRRGQTPQAFDLRTIRHAHELANNDPDVEVTDDCGLILKYKLADVYVVNGSDYNIKITHPIDLSIADKLFQMRKTPCFDTDKSALAGRVLAVFGGSSGIGKAIVDEARKCGATAFSLSKSGGTDISDRDSVGEALAQIYRKEKRIDYIVNTAGVLKMGRLDSRDIEDIRNEVDVNYMGCVHIAQFAPKYLHESKGGVLFFTSSSYTRGRALYAIYSSVKAGIVNLTQALSEEWMGLGIKINVISPERTATPMRFKSFGKEPTATLLTPEKVADVSLNVLLSSQTGQIFDVCNHK